MSILFLSKDFGHLSNATQRTDSELYRILAERQLAVHAVSGQYPFWIDSKGVKKFKVPSHMDYYNQSYDDTCYQYIYDHPEIDTIITSVNPVDIYKLPSHVRVLHLVHDTMHGFLLETDPDYSSNLDRINDCYKAEGDILKSICHVALTQSSMDTRYIGNFVPSRMITIPRKPNKRLYEMVSKSASIGATYRSKYDVFYGGHASWFRTWLCMSEVERLLEKYDLTAYVYIRRLRATHKIHNMSRITLNTSTKFDDTLHLAMKCSLIPHHYQSGYPTKLDMGLSNAMPILLKGDPLDYIDIDRYNACKDFVLSYDDDQSFIDQLNKITPEMRLDCLSFIEKYHNDDVIYGQLMSAIEYAHTL